MQKRVFDHNPLMGITKYFSYDEMTDEATITTAQDLTPLLESNKRAQNEQTSLDRWGDGRTVARVPLSIYYDWLKAGKTNDDAFLRRWLNDPDNKGFRFFLGKV